MKETGEITKTIGGKKRTFKFSMMAIKRFDQHYGFEMMETHPVMAICGLLYVGLLSYEKENDLPDNFNDDVVAGWMDDMSDDDIAEIWNVWEASMGKFTGKFGKVISKTETK